MQISPIEIIFLVCLVAVAFASRTSPRCWVRWTWLICLLLGLGIRAYRMHVAHEQSDEIEQLKEQDVKKSARITELETQTKDLDKFKEIAAKHEYRPLSPEIRKKLVEELASVKDNFTAGKVKISITQETWAPATTQKFTSQLAEILKDAGLDVTGPSFATVYLVSQSYPLEWGYNPEEIGPVDRLFQVVAQVMQSPNAARRATFPKGEIRIHFAGQTVFDRAGRVVIE